jgi:hypothetical protein
VMATAVARHPAFLRAAIGRSGGALLRVGEDTVQPAFPTAPDAVVAALDAQRALAVTSWSGTTQLIPALAALAAQHL